MPDNLSGAIIAAGRGERLRPAVNGRPKPLVRIDGEMLLERQARLMTAAALTPVHIIVNSETAMQAGMRRLKLPEATDLIVADTPNSMESLLRLGERIRPGNFVLATVDAIVPTQDFIDFVRRCDRAMSAVDGQNLDGVLGITRWRGDKRPLFLSRAQDGHISGFGVNTDGWVTAGLYCFNTRIFDFSMLARRRGLGALREFLGLLVDGGVQLGTYELGAVVDVDEAGDLAAARTALGRSQPRESRQ